MSSQPEETVVGFLAHDVARLIGRRFNQRAKFLGLNRTQCRALAYISRSEGIIQAALADRLDIEPISLVRLLDRMAEAGWVERRTDQADRRTRRLFLTDKAHALMVEIRAVSVEVSEEAFTDLDPADRQKLIELLQRVRNTLQRLDCASEAALPTQPETGSPEPEPSRTEPSRTGTPKNETIPPMKELAR